VRALRWDDVIKELISNNADLAPTTSTGQTPLMMAAVRGHVKV
jgi:ankyrin repeat protein